MTDGTDAGASRNRFPETGEKAMARRKIERPRLKEKKGRPFRVHYRYEGDGRSFSTGTTDRAEAKKILRRAEAYFDLGDDPAKANPNAKPEIVNGPGSMPWDVFRERYSARFKSENLRPSAAGGARSALNLAEKHQNPFWTQMMRAGMGFRSQNGPKDHLDNPGSVAKIDEADATMITPATHPARQDHCIPERCLHDVAAVMAATQASHAVERRSLLAHRGLTHQNSCDSKLR